MKKKPITEIDRTVLTGLIGNATSERIGLMTPEQSRLLGTKILINSAKGKYINIGSIENYTGGYLDINYAAWITYFLSARIMLGRATSGLTANKTIVFGKNCSFFTLYRVDAELWLHVNDSSMNGSITIGGHLKTFKGLNVISDTIPEGAVLVSSFTD